MSDELARLYGVIEATWPPAVTKAQGPFTLRDGAGGGKRVSSATVEGVIAAEDLPAAESAMQAMGQTPLFMIRAGDETLDALLAAQGYDIIDPVNIYACPVDDLATLDLPRVASFAIWEPLAIMRDIWAKGGIGPERVAVMERARCPKTGLFGRHDNRPAATGYVAFHEGIAMVHAIEVLARDRRQGVGRNLMIQAARWAKQQGAEQISVICTQANKGANALYAFLGMRLVGHYHYRIKG
ncbi:GNAT family N-acetyltransferase [Roseovarius sp. 2305UL8-3]|uniref:GNAT family N-acetyltransferase n=1 Tax=Roseovarius conchicola TaxID=3121636 RepID=UPI003528819D